MKPITLYAILKIYKKRQQSKQKLIFRRYSIYLKQSVQQAGTGYEARIPYEIKTIFIISN